MIDRENLLKSYHASFLGEPRLFTATGRIELCGNHTDHQGGRVLVCPAQEEIVAWAAPNGTNRICVRSQGFAPFSVELDGLQKDNYSHGTPEALTAGVAGGFLADFGTGCGGFDCVVASEVPCGGGMSSSAAYEILMGRIINELFYQNRADALTLALIGQRAENEYFGKPCGLMDQLAVSLGQTAMLDFSSPVPAVEVIPYMFQGLHVVQTGGSHEAQTGNYAEIPEDMYRVAGIFGKTRLGELSEEKFQSSLPELERLTIEGKLTRLQLNRAMHFYDENRRVLQAAQALKNGRYSDFLACINASGRSSEELLCNILPEGVTENDLSRSLKEWKEKLNGAGAVRVHGGGFSGTILVFEPEDSACYNLENTKTGDRKR